MDNVVELSDHFEQMNKVVSEFIKDFNSINIDYYFYHHHFIFNSKISFFQII